MKLWAAASAATLMMLAGGAQAQVSDADYPQYYDYIIDHSWACLSKQAYDGVQGGELQTNAEMHFQRKNSYEAYRFTGSGTHIITVEGRDYRGTFVMEGFGVNDSTFGTGVSITKMTTTSSDTLPYGWSWENSDYLSLYLVKDKPEYKYPYYLEGSDNTSSGLITYECVVKDD